MFDTRLRTKIDPVLNRLAYALSKRGISANALSLGGVVLAFIAFIMLVYGSFLLALLFILLNRLLDGLDGAVARVSTPTSFGAFLDSACDFFFYGLIPLGFAVNASENQLATAVLLFSFYLNGGFFLSYASLTTQKSANKGFYYLNGLMEGAETIAFFIGFCLFPSHYVYLASAFALLCFISAAGRIWLAFKNLG
jgi:phosphatidylglycerophosphate synthase